MVLCYTVTLYFNVANNRVDIGFSRFANLVALWLVVDSCLI